MAVTEESRHRLYRRLAEVLGQEQATTLMEHLPPIGWADVATKRDLDVLGRDLRSEMATLGTELRAEMAVLRGEVCGAMGELRGAMGELRAQVAKDQRQLLLAVMVANAGLAGVVIGAAQLF